MNSATTRRMFTAAFVTSAVLHTASAVDWPRWPGALDKVFWKTAQAAYRLAERPA